MELTELCCKLFTIIYLRSGVLRKFLIFIRDFCSYYTIFPVLVGNWRTARGLSVNKGPSFEGSRAGIGDGGSGLRPQRSRLGRRQKSADCTAKGRRKKQPSARVCAIKNVLTVGRCCYTTIKECNFRQLPNLDGRPFFVICNLQSAICNLKSS